MSTDPLFPLVRAAPGQGAHLPPAVREYLQDRAARAARRECARSFRIGLEEETRAAPGARPSVRGWYSSTACASRWIAAIIYPHPVGIALARIQPQRQELVRAVTTRDELELLGGFRWLMFTRLWSAKEAVLEMHAQRAEGGDAEGDFADCRVVVAASPRGLVLHYRGRLHHVHQEHHRGHFASLCAEGSDGAEIRWDWRDAPAGGGAS